MTRDGRRLVLFDIDGTLLSAGCASRDALVAALEAVDRRGSDLGYMVWLIQIATLR